VVQSLDLRELLGEKLSKTELHTVCGISRWNNEVTMCPGVFAELIDNAAFIDKATFGIDGTLRKRIDRSFRELSNPAIGGPGRPYARSLHYIYEPTGNPFELKYGANRRYRGLFDTKLILRSEGRPVSRAELSAIITRLFRKGYRSDLRAVEFTFDTSIPFRFFETHILTRARSVRTLIDDRNRQTLYAGRPGARWMLRIYEKTRNTTRVEYVLRHPLLIKAGVSPLENLEKLKTLDLTRMVRFPAICRPAFENLIKGKITGKRLEMLHKWPGHWSSATLLSVLDDYDLEGDAILRMSAEEQLLKRMQDRFTW